MHPHSFALSRFWTCNNCCGFFHLELTDCPCLFYLLHSFLLLPPIIFFFFITSALIPNLSFFSDCTGTYVSRDKTLTTSVIAVQAFCALSGFVRGHYIFLLFLLLQNYSALAVRLLSYNNLSTFLHLIHQGKHISLNSKTKAWQCTDCSLCS